MSSTSFFAYFSQAIPRPTEDTWMPDMDFRQDTTTNTVTATFDLPGLKKTDIGIFLCNDVLKIDGEVPVRKERGHIVRGQKEGRFSASMCVPWGLQEGHVKASLEDGVLTVTFPMWVVPEPVMKQIMIS
ncbi:HSP20-like chaperone [Desarmillaria tabescens]|uniref:HSP20-like chaperone n=1 Tax=Armillaria tabescens TaxID=1929756 RepID=A0AA39NRL8_ARMTA|nr:HSP20-like chaperone [Desarmillaria tabescens]KAK0470243.1 HSP20-like chaperone [Desarmillaria tabescens]